MGYRILYGADDGRPGDGPSDPFSTSSPLASTCAATASTARGAYFGRGGKADIDMVGNSVSSPCLLLLSIFVQVCRYPDLKILCLQKAYSPSFHVVPPIFVWHSFRVALVDVSHIKRLHLNMFAFHPTNYQQGGVWITCLIL